jgi:hypothetical protein
MYPLDISRTVKLIIDTCLNVQPDQRILIAGFTEDDLRRLPPAPTRPGRKSALSWLHRRPQRLSRLPFLPRQ